MESDEQARKPFPETLRQELDKLPRRAPPRWLTLVSLPPIVVHGHVLDEADIQRVLTELKYAVPGKPTPVFEALKSAADLHTLDAFVWKVFQLWLAGGAPPDDKWALISLSVLGGDGSILKLAPLIAEWPGESQSKRAELALDCLYAVGTDTAVMALSNIARKVKYPALKARAEQVMAKIAEQRNLTGEQLEDRIVPDCGLAAKGTREFDYGGRKFHFVLGPNMKPLVRDESRKTHGNLPAFKKGDDPQKVEAAMADWKVLKKTLSEVLKIQVKRMENAMKNVRFWSVEEFRSFLLGHPLMINLIRQLVMATYDNSGNLMQSFRITEDGTFADEKDDAIELEHKRVGVVHPAHLTEASRAAWGQLMTDYEIIPPFQQLGRRMYAPEPKELETTEISRFDGIIAPLMKAQAILSGTGFLPSNNYSKYISFTDISVVLDVDQSGMGISIRSIYFHRGKSSSRRLRIRDVHPVIFSETIRVVHAMTSSDKQL